jgi:hypothetical protein
MSVQDRFAEVRGQGIRRLTGPLRAQLEHWAGATSNKFVDAAWELVGTLRDSIRAGQYDLGVPFQYAKQVILSPGERTTMPMNVKKFGVIQQMVPLVTNITATPSDTFLLAGFTRVQIAAQTFWDTESSVLAMRTDGLASSYTGFVPKAGGTEDTATSLGYLRRIPVAQGDVIECEIVNNSTTDTYKVALIVTQYGMMPPALANNG